MIFRVLDYRKMNLTRGFSMSQFLKPFASMWAACLFTGRNLHTVLKLALFPYVLLVLLNVLLGEEMGLAVFYAVPTLHPFLNLLRRPVIWIFETWQLAQLFDQNYLAFVGYRVLITIVSTVPSLIFVSNWISFYHNLKKEVKWIAVRRSVLPLISYFSVFWVALFVLQEAEYRISAFSINLMEKSFNPYIFSLCAALPYVVFVLLTSRFLFLVPSAVLHEKMTFQHAWKASRSFWPTLSLFFGIFIGANVVCTSIFTRQEWLLPVASLCPFLLKAVLFVAVTKIYKETKRLKGV